MARLARGGANTVAYTHDAGENWEIVIAEGELRVLRDMGVFPGTEDVSKRGGGVGEDGAVIGGFPASE